MRDDYLTFVRGSTVRKVHPDAHGTMQLLRKGGFTQVAPPQPEPEEETAVTEDPFDFLTDNQAQALRDAGIETLEQLAEVDAETLLAIDGIGPAAIEKILDATADLT